jgi:hypothetical protein
MVALFLPFIYRGTSCSRIRNNPRIRIGTQNLVGQGDVFEFFKYFIQHCICRPPDSSVSVDAGIEPMTVTTLARAVRCSNHSARSRPLSFSMLLLKICLFITLKYHAFFWV